jgi:hypothetical protein
MGNIGGRQRPLRNLVLAHKYDAFLLLCVPNEVLKKLNVTGNTVDAIVRADRHHPSPARGLGVENVEVVFQVL